MILAKYINEPRAMAAAAKCDEYTTEIHRKPCGPCPSTKGEPDDEVTDILTLPRQQQLETVFRCAWRREKLCKGYCDTLSTTEEELRSALPIGTEGGA